MISYSILICTYNPDERLLSRCLRALQMLDITGITIEVILVDNNSSPELGSFSCVQELLHSGLPVTLVVEARQGLSFARKRGILESSGRYLVFFDDDNEPYPDYLQELNTLWKQYSSVGAWGPGNVWVDYIDGIAPELKAYADHWFQERHEDFIKYACLRSQQSFYPYGTGLGMKREYALHYITLLSEGVLSQTDRDGNRLTSGGDLQMVLSCVVQGAAAGVAPGVKIKHIIPGKRTNLAYIKKLIYGVHVCYDPAIRQLIPEHAVNFGRPFKSNTALWIKVVKRYWKVKVSADIGKEFRLIEWLALLTSAYLAAGKPVPAVIDRTVQRLL